MRLDLSSLASVRAFVEACHVELDQPIDALVCNGGISRGPARTVDGIDSVFATNHLGHFLLTLALLDRMSPAGRVISVSSDMHQPPGPRLRWPVAEALAHPSPRRPASVNRYSYSKLCNLYFVYELSRRLRARSSGIRVAAFNPGLMTDSSFASTPGPVAAIMKRVFAARVGSVETSAAALAELAAGPATEDTDGCYFDRTATASTRSSELSYNPQNARDLWDVSARLAAITP